MITNRDERRARIKAQYQWMLHYYGHVPAHAQRLFDRQLQAIAAGLPDPVEIERSELEETESPF